MEVRGIEVEFTPEVLLWLLTGIGFDERDLKKRFSRAAFTNVHTTPSGLPHTKHAVMWNEKKERPYLFVCILREVGAPWRVIKAMETCAGHENGYVVIKDDHIRRAQDACMIHHANREDKLLRVVARIAPAQHKKNGDRARFIPLASIRASEFEGFEGDGVELLKKFVRPEKIAKMTDVPVPPDYYVSIQVLPVRSKTPLCRFNI